MKYIGAHVSISGGVETAPARAREIGANALGIFTKNQRQWRSPALTEESVEAFRRGLSEAQILSEHVLVHDSYLINIGSPEETMRRKSLDALIDEAQRVRALGLRLLNFHPGSGLGKITEAETIALVSAGIDEVLAAVPDIVLCIETTAGQGAHVGYRFEHLAEMIAKASDPGRVGVCLDSCHVFAAGYDIRTPAAYAETMAAFEEIIGFRFLKGLHLNDAMVELGSRKDRHDTVGHGHLGAETFRNFMRDERLDGLPLILETPDEEKWPQEIATLRKMAR